MTLPAINATDYKLVTSNDDLEVDANYIIVATYKNATYAMKDGLSTVGKKATCAGATVTPVGDIISLKGSEGVVVVKLCESGDPDYPYLLKYMGEKVEGYISAKTYKEINTENIGSTNSNYIKMNIDVSSTTSTISSKTGGGTNSAYTKFYYNGNGTSKFAFYSAKQSALPQLYKEVVEAAAFDAPAISVPSGTYNVVQNVTLTVPKGATKVRYTTDDAVDLKKEGTEYTQGSTISISKSCTLRAIATDGTNFSATATATYTMKTSAPVITAADAVDGVFTNEDGFLNVTFTCPPYNAGEVLISYEVKDEMAEKTTGTVEVGEAITVYGNATITATALYMNGDFKESDPVTATYKWSNSTAMKGVFARINSVDKISAGGEVIVVVESLGKIMSTDNGNSKREAIDQDVNGVCLLESTSSAKVFTLGEGTKTGTYTLVDEDGNYLSLSTDNTNIAKVKGDVVVSFEGENVKISNSEPTNKRSIVWRAGTYNVFGNYVNANIDNNKEYYNVQLYKRLNGVSANATVSNTGSEPTELVEGASYKRYSTINLTSEGSCTYCLVHKGKLTNGTFNKTTTIALDESGEYTLATPMKIVNFTVEEITVSNGTELLSMSAGKYYQVNVNLQGVKAHDGVLYACTTEPTVNPSDPRKTGFDYYEDKVDKFVQRDWVAIAGLGSDYVGMNIGTGFKALYDGSKLVPVEAPAVSGEAAEFTLNTFVVPNVFYGNYANMVGWDYYPFFVAAKVNEVATYSGKATDASTIVGSGKAGTYNGAGLKVEGATLTTGKYVKFEGVLLADAEANGGVKVVCTGEVDDTETGVEAATEASAVVYGANGAVVVKGATGLVEVFDATGRIVKAENVEGEAAIEVAAGYYIVRTADTTATVIVK